MKTLNLLTILILLLLATQYGTGEVTRLETEPVVTESIQSRVFDPRAKVLQAYLAKHNAPLQYHAQDFVDAADEYNLDWKFVAAISGVESTFGKHVPGGTEPENSSFNGWGWGVYGTQALYFDSWRDGIFTVSEGLRKNYFDQGLTEPYTINKRYAASKSWGKNVTFFLNEIAKFEKAFTKDQSRQTSAILEVQEAGRSAVLN